MTPHLQLIRLLDYANKEWLVVNEIEGENLWWKEPREIAKLEWNDDLMIWMDEHREEVEAGDVNTFLEYRRLRLSA